MHPGAPEGGPSQNSHAKGASSQVVEPVDGFRASARMAAAGRPRKLPAMTLGAVFDLNGPAHYVHWHFFQMSVANVVVVLLMIVVFILAIALPFPKREIEE